MIVFTEQLQKSNMTLSVIFAWSSWNSSPAANTSILFQDSLPSQPMVIELLATLFGVHITIALGEAFQANREVA